MTKDKQPTSPRGKVLIVDDNPQNLELLEAYMEDLPEVQTLTATNGEAALEVVRREHPDLVLLDVMMPKMSGFEVCKRMKGDPSTADIAVVMVTALNEQMDIARGMESGTDDYLTKPVSRQDLIGRIRSLLRNRQLKGKLDRSLAYMEELESDMSEGFGAVEQEP
jgi:two-component system alkaline phosphatase synthesis response regulator PhoP